MKTGSKLAVTIASAAIAAFSVRILVGHNAARADGGSSATRNSVALTIYSDDFGMVHEVRPCQVSKGDNRLNVTDVSKTLDPQSVSLSWSGQSALPQVVAQTYNLGVNTEGDLTKRFIGRQIELVRYGQNGQEAARQNGELMVQGDGGIVLQSEGSLYVNPPGTIVAPVSSEIVSIPQLSVQADSPSAQQADLNMTYLTRGISWSADYVATLSSTDDSLAIECWATVLNKTGVDYPNARISLITGSPNRAAMMAEDREAHGKAPSYLDGHEFAGETRLRTGGSFGAGRAFSAPVDVGEYHAYPVSKPTSVIQDQLNRIRMFSSTSVAVKKDYNTRPPVISAYDDGYNWCETRTGRRGTVAVSITFFNNLKNGLGSPLPHGAIRLYEPGGDGAVAYVGAAAVVDTPENERVDLTPGTAYDLFTEWRTIRSSQVAKHVVRKRVELNLHNEKSVDVKLRVVQGFEGRWKIVDEPIKHSNLSGSEAQWIVPVKAHSTLTYQFTVEMND